MSSIHGLIEIFRDGLRFFRSFTSPNYVGVKPPAVEPLASFDITLPSSLPVTTELVTLSPTGQIGTRPDSGGSGGGHTQNTDTGTTAASFQIDSGNSGSRLAMSNGVLRVRNFNNSIDAPFAASRLFSSGALEASGTSLLLNVVDGTLPTTVGLTDSTNGGIRLRRSVPNNPAVILWENSSETWRIGTDAKKAPAARIVTGSFDASDLVNGIYTWTHGFQSDGFPFIITDTAGNVFHPDKVTYTTFAVQVDLGYAAGFGGTWQIRAAL